jgi:hypothetical protein
VFAPTDLKLIKFKILLLSDGDSIACVGAEVKLMLVLDRIAFQN